MYNRNNVYIHNGKRVQIEWFQFKHKGRKSVVIREERTEGPSLTNSIEGAISRILYIMKEDVTIYQDCGDEGVFHVEYDGGIGLDAEGNDFYVVESVNWHYFSKDLTSLELLYAQ